MMRVAIVLALCAVAPLAARADQPAGADLSTESLLRWVAPPEVNLTAGELPVTSETPQPPQSPQVVEPQRSLSPDMLRLRDQLRRTLLTYYPKRLNTRDHNPWELMHAIIGWGVHAHIDRNGPGGPPVNAVSWMAVNGRCAGHELLYVNRDRVEAHKGPYVQGHYGQLLAILAQSRVMPEYPLYVSGRQFTVADLIESEKLTCQTGTELTFKLISLMHYLDSDAEWVSDDGQRWSLPRLIEEEIRSPIRGAACGGTHRLMGLSYAVQKRKIRGEPMDGQYWRAQQYINDYHRYAFSLQNSDGSFSTAWFTKREAKDDVERRIQTTGHILEWLVYSVPEEALASPQMVRAVNYLSRTLLSQPRKEWSVGPLGHAVHALSLYNERMFDAPVEVRPDRLQAYEMAIIQRRRTQQALQQSQAARARQQQPAVQPPQPQTAVKPSPAVPSVVSGRRSQAEQRIVDPADNPPDAVKLPVEQGGDAKEPALLDDVLQAPLGAVPSGTEAGIAADAADTSPGETPDELAEGPLERQARRDPAIAPPTAEPSLGPVLRAPAQLNGQLRTLKR